VSRAARAREYVQVVSRLAVARMREHAKAIFTVATVATVPIRLLAVSGWNFDTALALLQESDTRVLLTGTVMTSYGWAIVFVPLVVTVRILTARTRRVMVRSWLVGLLAVLLLAFAPIGVPLFWFAVGYLVLGPFLRLVAATDKKEDRVFRTAVAGVYGSVAAAAAVVVLWTFVVGQQPWLPRETVRAANDAVVIGYVVADGADLVVLRGRDSHVVHLPGPAKARVICHANTGDDRTAISVVLHTKAYPHCDGSLVP